MARGLPPLRFAAQGRKLLRLLMEEATPLDLRLVGRTVLHCAIVGLTAGVAGVVFFALLEAVERLLLEALAGYEPLRAAGERVFGGSLHGEGHGLRPFLLAGLLTFGGLATGLVTSRLAPETAGGGGDTIIDAFHRRDARVRRRTPFVKALTSLLTLGTGGSGGREGPTMLIGGSIGSLVAESLGLGARERRILLVAGVAAGISAVFRTPLGAALLATEILYRDEFESEALVPAVLASVISYSVAISVFGETTLFAHAPRYPFVPAHLPLYALLALCVAALAGVFEATLRGVRAALERLVGRPWLRPAVGALLLAALAVPVVSLVGEHLGVPGHGVGLLGAGYGAAQLAITGAPFLPEGWRGVELLLLLCAGKLVASALTVGSGGSAGDFAPSLVLGGLFGGAFGRAVALLTDDPRIDAGAFALVGMGTFYGGIAHVPLSALVLVCELARSYDLLVPLMLAEAVAFVALRKRTLYHAQPISRAHSPAHRVQVLPTIRIAELLRRDRAVSTCVEATPGAELVAMGARSPWQHVFPVVDDAGRLSGLISRDDLELLAEDTEAASWLVAADARQEPASVPLESSLKSAIEVMLDRNLRELPVVDLSGRVVGLVSEIEVSKAFWKAARALESGEGRASQPPSQRPTHAPRPDSGAR